MHLRFYAPDSIGAVDELIARHGKIVRPVPIYTDSFGRLSLEVGKTTSYYRRETSSMEWTEIDTRIESGSSYHYRLATTVLVRAQGRRLSSVGAAERSGSILPLGCRIYDVVASGSTFHSRIVHFFERLNLFCPLFSPLLLRRLRPDDLMISSTNVV